jgi:hypothetical protein
VQGSGTMTPVQNSKEPPKIATSNFLLSLNFLSKDLQKDFSGFSQTSFLG